MCGHLAYAARGALSEASRVPAGGVYTPRVRRTGSAERGSQDASGRSADTLRVLRVARRVPAGAVRKTSVRRTQSAENGPPDVSGRCADTWRVPHAEC